MIACQPIWSPTRALRFCSIVELARKSAELFQAGKLNTNYTILNKCVLRLFNFILNLSYLQDDLIAYIILSSLFHIFNTPESWFQSA